MSNMMILTVTPAQWDVIAEGLGEVPLKRSQPVLQECVRQIAEQLQAARMLATLAKAAPGTVE